MGRRGRAFFDRPTERVARDLLGHRFAVRDRRGVRSVRLVETEAYVAHDRANHAYRGPTRRNRSMFLRPGTLYVYRIHQVVCANLVTRPGEAVLLRAGAPLGAVRDRPNGPGRLCRALGIRIEDDGADAARGRKFFLFPSRGRRGPIAVGPRVGLRRARARRLRYLLVESPWVSRPRPRGRGRQLTSASPSGSHAGAKSRRSRTTRRRPSGGGRSGVRSVGR